MKLTALQPIKPNTLRFGTQVKFDDQLVYQPVKVNPTHFNASLPQISVKTLLQNMLKACLVAQQTLAVSGGPDTAVQLELLRPKSPHELQIQPKFLKGHDPKTIGPVLTLKDDYSYDGGSLELGQTVQHWLLDVANTAKSTFN